MASPAGGDDSLWIIRLRHGGFVLRAAADMNTAWSMAGFASRQLGREIPLGEGLSMWGGCPGIIGLSMAELTCIASGIGSLHSSICGRTGIPLRKGQYGIQGHEEYAGY